MPDPDTITGSTPPSRFPPPGDAEIAVSGMMPVADTDSRWSDALLAARVLAAGAGTLGGVRLRAGAGPVRNRWLEMARAMIDAGALKTEQVEKPWLRIPASSAAGRLTGGIDIAATLTAGRPVHEKGLLARADGGVIVLGMAERLAGASAAIIGRTMDDRMTSGASGRNHPARFSVIALDESAEDDEDVPAALADRLTLDVRLDGLSIHDAPLDLSLAHEMGTGLPDAEACALPAIADDLREAAAAISLALPARPLRRSLDLLRVARILAAFEGQPAVDGDHLATAVRLCLGLTLNAAEQPESDAEEADPEPDDAERQADTGDEIQGEPPARDQSGSEEADADRSETEPTEEDMLVAVAAASRAVLAELDRPDCSTAQKSARTGKSGGFKSGSRRGRPAGIVSRPPYPEARPDIVSTLRAAIPWQRLRNPEFALAVDGKAPPLRILPSDFRYIRFRHRTESTAIFAVDASGSTAMERLAEAKGAIELLLGDCYVRRDHVALITFRGRSAETLLEPTRSLVRAKRSLTGLPGGGPTPLAGAIRRSLEIAGMVQRRGQSPLIVYLTDGSGNIALDGEPDRARARDDARLLARQGAALGYRSILIDISRRPREATRELARSMQAQYCPLPNVSANAVNAIVSAELQKGARS
ncbi:magnesium chelatase ATPase subunit D [Hoeflea sp.]|uniref:magnesium chelatase ATPase subunit D n=1 Tax=Hoeflea sp. TaxID=1940281 RepID=UPI003B515B51